jgi:hypothetical protein
MAARSIPLRWLLIPDQRFDAAALVTDGCTQAGARPGTVTPDDDRSQYALRVSGAQDAPMTFQVTEGGMAGKSGARVGYFLNGEDDTALRGWMPPNLITRYHCLSWSGALTTDIQAFDAVADPVTGRILVVVYRTPADLSIAVLNPATQTAVAVAATSPTLPVGITPAAPSLVRLPSGRVLMIVGRQSVMYSDDFGTTWNVSARRVRVDDLSATYTARRTVRHAASGALVHLAWNRDGSSAAAALCVSYDDGATWTQTDTGTNSKTKDWVSVAASPAGVCTWVVSSSSGVSFRAGAPNGLLLSGSATATFGTGTVYAAGTGWVDDDGVHWWTGETSTGDRELWRSEDGTSWAQFKYGLHSAATASTAHWTPGVMLAAGGAAWAVEIGKSYATGTGINLRRLGGWSTVATHPDGVAPLELLDTWRFSIGGTPLSGTAETRLFLAGYADTASPAPTDRGWTPSGTATLAEGVTGWKITTTAGNAISYNPAPPLGSHDFVVAHAQLYVESGGSVSTNDIALIVDAGDHLIHIRFSTTQIRVVDPNASTTLSTVSFDTTTPFCILAMVEDDLATVLVRRPSATTWTEVCDRASLASGGTSATVTWGHLAAGAGTNVSHWQFVALLATSATDDAIHWSSSSSEASASPIGHPVGPQPIALGDVATGGQTFVAAVDGPALVGETFAAAPTFDYPATSVLWSSSPSPRRKWRSVDDTEQIIEFAVDTERATSPNASSHLGLVIRGANFPQIVLEGWDGADWNTIADVSLVVDDGLTWSRQGDTIVLVAGGSRHLWQGELVGGTVVLGSLPLRIAQQHAGRAVSGGAQPVLRVSSDPDAAGSSGTTGVIWAPDACVIVPNHRTRYEGYRLRIPAATTADGYFEAGLLAVCSAHPMGQEWDWGWNWKREAPALERREVANGGTRYRSRGPTVRMLEVAWPSGISAHRLRSATHDWADIEADGTWSTQMISGSTLAEFPVAAGDVPWLVDGLFAELDGGAVPCALVNAAAFVGADLSADGAVALTDPTTWLWGHLQNGIALEHQLGDDEDGEVYRVQTIALREAT